jgi:hypothetical protein
MVVVLSLVLAASPSLERARTAFRALDCGAAVDQAIIAERSGSLQTTEVVEVMWIQARCAIALGDRKTTEAALERLLTEDPAFTPADTESPKVQEAVRRVREALYPKDLVSLEALTGSAARQRFRLVDPYRKTARVELVRRQRPGDAWQTTTLEVRDRIVAVDEASVTGSQWYLRAVDRAESVVASVGTAESPRGVETTVTAPVSAVPTGPRGSHVAAIVSGVLALVAAAIATGLVIDALAQARASATLESANDVRTRWQGAQRQHTLGIGLFIGAGVLTAAGLTLGLAF